MTAGVWCGAYKLAVWIFLRPVHIRPSLFSILVRNTRSSSRGRIREFNVFSVVLPCTTPLERVLALKPEGIVLSGGPSSVYDAAAPKADPAVLACGLPVLGICYGLQFMTHHLGGRVVPAAAREYGHAEVEVIEPSALFHGLPGKLEVWMSHGDHAESLAPGFRVTARTANAVAGIADDARRMYAVQFHPEVAHTKQGMELLRNFAVDICGARQDWTPANFIASTVAKIREQGRHDRACDLRVERWCRFKRRSRAGAAGHRRAADLHLREQRRTAQG